MEVKIKTYATPDAANRDAEYMAKAGWVPQGMAGGGTQLTPARGAANTALDVVAWSALGMGGVGLFTSRKKYRKTAPISITWTRTPEAKAVADAELAREIKENQEREAKRQAQRAAEIAAKQAARQAKREATAVASAKRRREKEAKREATAVASAKRRREKEAKREASAARRQERSRHGLKTKGVRQAIYLCRCGEPFGERAQVRWRGARSLYRVHLAQVREQVFPISDATKPPAEAGG